ncbi:type IV secretory system conjugative DNA transfer family protein [Nocardia carnea]|uniref:type IV secretory system conjugative DNA transfer family protein n=1 Tax=Nocardia carnea TaxID=37328 RepID=UPI0024582931|nr:TraM recognition domain-containing protein [Nocardia carnea]
MGEELALLMLVLAVILAFLLSWAALCLGGVVAGQQVQLHPVAAVMEVVMGERVWPWQSTVLLAVWCLVGGWLGVFWRRRDRRERPLEIDAAARTMQRPSELTVGRVSDNTQAAQRLLKDAPPEVRALPGPPLGYTVIGGFALHIPAELCAFIEAGARTGKTMAWAVPAVLSGWGPVLATSNRPDLYRHTRTGRAQRGRVWLSDNQAVTGEVVCGFWVNLLREITTISAARKLASFFVSAVKEPNARVDSYFDGGAQELLSCYILAAAVAGGDLLHVVEWLGRDQDDTPQLILKSMGHHRAAARVAETQALYARQRDGLFDMARRFLHVLSDDTYARMVTPPSRRTIHAHESENEIAVESREADPTHDLPEFLPREFVTSTDTLYALSMAGPDSAAPLISALVGQVLEAALATARARVDGRLAVPLLGVLDEAANCCPIAALPDYYTYAGGHGVILMTFLQVLQQGEDLWGVNGMKTIRAQSIEVYGGGITETEFLQQWSTVSDEHEVAERSRSIGSNGLNRTLNWRSEAILSVADLAALPKNRALVRLPGHKPILVRKPWWQESEYREVIEASLREFADADDADEVPAQTGDGQSGKEGVRV